MALLIELTKRNSIELNLVHNLDQLKILTQIYVPKLNIPYNHKKPVLFNTSFFYPLKLLTAHYITLNLKSISLTGKYAISNITKYINPITM